MSATPAAPAAGSVVDPPAASSVALLPARMLNEFVYCPRLFFSALSGVRLQPPRASLFSIAANNR
jgi:hypothetical protein